MSDLEAAAEALRNGDLVVYPTETVYGLGANALEPAAVESVFAAKGREYDKPISIAVSSVDDALEYVHVSDREEQFMRAFLPGPVTILCERRESIPDVLTAGRDRVGIRVPDCALALELCEQVAPLPITATSANRSGAASVRRIADLDPEIERAAAIVLECEGELEAQSDSDSDSDSVDNTPESTVVDVSSETIHRRGALAEEITRWLET